MNMQAGRVRTAPAPAGASRRLYLPTIVIAGLAASLSYRGWTALAGTGVARSFDAGRYNLAKGHLQGLAPELTVTRIEAGGGWFLTQNLLAKAEYVNQKYLDFPATDIRNGGQFKGFMVEGVLAF